LAPECRSGEQDVLYGRHELADRPDVSYLENDMRVRALLTASTTGLALLVVPVQAASAGPVHPAAVVHKACSASVSVAHPKARSNESIRISKIGAGVKVTVKAKYKTTTTTKTANSTKTGTASALYDVGRPTRGFRVVVNVTASKGNTTWACSTSFVPA
jgi:hypothetical protein